MTAMRLALAQLNPMVGDVFGNSAAVLAAYEEGVTAGAGLVAAGELALTGYPPEDLVLKPAFIQATAEALEQVAFKTGPVPLVVGFVESLAHAEGPGRHMVASGGSDYPPLANAAAVCRHGKIEAVYRKQRLPNYGVFDEARYFRAGTSPVVVDVEGTPVGITICEDLWGEHGPVEQAARAGATVVVNINASPWSRGKRHDREHWALHHARAQQVWLAYVNCVGGQDEVVFDGDSFLVSPGGQVCARGPQLQTGVVVADIPSGQQDSAPRLDPLAEVYGALVLGTRDYVAKNGFRSALLGVSGGIDSALVAAIAADALGPELLTGVAMPSPHSSPGSVADARDLCDRLGIRWLELPIEPAMTAYGQILADRFRDTSPGVAEENLQSRIRGTLLMALSNKFGDIVLATGNKSEYAVGYSTLYGDMAGGFAVVKDCPKTLVYDLARHRNTVSPVIPQATIDKPPSAELRPDQRDTDSLPPYEVLDPILELYVEDDRSVAQIVAAGFDEAVVRRVAALVDRAEYKRRQAAPGVKVTERAFGKDRRMPITQGWSG